MTDSDPSEDLDDTLGLLERCHDGDQDALRALLARDLVSIRAAAHRQLRGVVRNFDQTDDVVHDLVVRVLEREPRFVVTDRDSFRALMTRIVTNQLRNRARDLNREKRSPGRERRLDGESVLDSGGARPEHGVTAPIDRASREEERDWIRLGMLLLASDDHEVLHLREWEQLSFREIGDQVGVSEDAARMRHKRAVQRLTRCVFLLKSGRVDEIATEAD